MSHMLFKYSGMIKLRYCILSLQELDIHAFSRFGAQCMQLKLTTMSLNYITFIYEYCGVFFLQVIARPYTTFEFQEVYM